MNILVPTDFSEIADNALAYAAMLVSRLEGKIILLHVIPPDSLMWKSSSGELVAEANKKQEDIKRKLAAKGVDVSDIECHVISDSPLPAHLKDFLSKLKIDYIVMGTGGSGLSGAKLGSFTLGMIDNAHLPVIAVPTQAKAHRVSQILYPTDLENVLEETRTIVPLAKAFGAAIHIVHIPHEDIGSELLAYHGLREINKLAHYEPITTSVLHSHEVTKAIDQQLTATGADLLVMFSHKKRLFEKLFKGSRTEEESGHTSIPLLLYTKPGAQ